ncbi:flagellar protein FlaG [Sulfurimonas sp. SAG-AH-194-L11]|nr:flagellar protein FlaG [Sulfurimonas sp. SAG-AH-194-L11]MDF1877450.1 flagellar protein FlaG [Sulfurimonas sp. SAG-AH-194-L11]
MDGIANVAKQQQTQVSSIETQVRAVEQAVQMQAKQTNVEKGLQEEAKTQSTSINSQEDVKELVTKLNKAMNPMSTNLKFGVDSQDVFYVSVREADSGKLIRRFPAEQAQDFLPKMQEVTGILFDSKG